MGLEYLEYLFGGFLYLMSSKFREKKKHTWENQSNMYKIYEVGMWVTVPIFSAMAIVAVLFM